MSLKLEHNCWDWIVSNPFRQGIYCRCSWAIAGGGGGEPGNVPGKAGLSQAWPRTGPAPLHLSSLHSPRPGGGQASCSAHAGSASLVNKWGLREGDPMACFETCHRSCRSAAQPWEERDAAGQCTQSTAKREKMKSRAWKWPWRPPGPGVMAGPD